MEKAEGERLAVMAEGMHQAGEVADAHAKSAATIQYNK